MFENLFSQFNVLIYAGIALFTGGALAIYRSSKVLKNLKNYSRAVGRPGALSATPSRLSDMGSKEDEKEKPKALTKSAEDDKNNEKAQKEFFKVLQVRSYFYYLYGFYPDTPIARSFKQAVEIAKSYLGAGGVYHIPWFLVIGPSQAGKSTLLQNLGMPNPLRAENMRDQPEGWWFFDQAIFLEYPLQPENEQKWGTFLRLLTNYRPRRPLDGIVLTLSCKDLLIYLQDPASKSLENLAKETQKYILQLYETVGMRLPIYILFTGADQVPGLRSALELLQKRGDTQIVGWSQPYTVNTAYSPAWLDACIEEMDAASEQLEMHRFAVQTESGNEMRSAFLKFRFSHLRPALETYLNTLFADGLVSETVFLRGFYFSSTSLPESFLELTPRDLKEEIGVSSAYRRLSFVKDLFFQKVFKEFSLARPMRNLVVSRSRLLNVAQIAALLFFALWGGQLYFNYYSLRNGSQSLLPLLENVNAVLVDLQKNKQKNPDAYIQAQALPLLRNMIDVNLKQSFYISMPVSWVSNYDQLIQKSLGLVWEKFILKAFQQALKSKEERLVELSQDPVEMITTVSSPQELPLFLKVQEFVGETLLFETQVRGFNRLAEEKNVRIVGDLARYLFNTELPGGFYENARYYEASISQPYYIDLSQISARIQPLFEKLLNQWSSQTTSLTPTGLFGPLITSTMSISQAGALRQYKLTEVLQFLRVILDSGNKLTQDNFGWIQEMSFDPGLLFRRLMENVAKSEVLSTPTNLLKLMDTRFLDFQKGLLRFQLPLIGPVFAIQNKVILPTPSTRYRDVTQQIQTFLDQPFLQQNIESVRLDPIKADEVVFFDESVMRQLYQQTRTFQGNLQKSLGQGFPEVAALLQSVGQKCLQGLIMQTLVQAKTSESITGPAQGLQNTELFEKQVQNLKTLLPVFAFVMKLLEGDVQGYLQDYGSSLLKRLDDRLDSLNLYQIQADTGEQMEGDGIWGLKALGVSSIAEMRGYVEVQRQQLMNLAQNFAEPILSFLESFPNLPLQTASRVQKWKGILKSLNDYNRRVPNSSLSVLEKFLMQDLNKMDLKACVQEMITHDPFEGNSDFFLDKRQALRTLALKGCSRLIKEQAQNKYQEIQSFFNQNLGGRFPFSKNPQANSATTQNIQDFVILLKDLSAQERQALNILFPDTQAQRFLVDMDRLLPFFLAINEPMSFKVVFRAPQGENIAEKYVVEWALRSGQTYALLGGPEQTLAWAPGEPIEVLFKWPINHPIQPTTDFRQPLLRIDGKFARFIYTSQWSLLDLLRNHMVKVIGGEGALLQFRVPVVGGEARTENTVSHAYLYILLQGGVFQTLQWPFTFPHAAPNLEEVELSDDKEAPSGPLATDEGGDEE